MHPFQELSFVALLLLSQLSPGPDQAFVTRSSLSYGLEAGIIVSLGIGTGIIAHAAIACSVGSALLQSSWGMFFYWLAGAWIIYLAWKIWPKKSAQPQQEESGIQQKSVNLLQLYKDALLCNLMNPKATLFFISLSAPLLETPHGIGYSIFVGSLIVVTGTLGWMVWAWAFQIKPVRRLYASHTVGIDRIFSLALFFFGASLFLEQIIK